MIDQFLIPLSFDMDRLQPNPQTFAHQLTLWTRLLLSWAKHHKVFRIDAGAADGGDCREVLENKSIGRESLVAVRRARRGLKLMVGWESQCKQRFQVDYCPARYVNS